jgi:hypothetical protein
MEVKFYQVLIISLISSISSTHLISSDEIEAKIQEIPSNQHKIFKQKNFKLPAPNSLDQSANIQTINFIIEPQDHILYVGMDVTLDCVISNSDVIVQWTKANFGLGSDRDLPGYERYSIIGSNESGNYSLHIKNLQVEDDDFYQCQFQNNNVKKRSRYAKLTVISGKTEIEEIREEMAAIASSSDKLESNSIILKLILVVVGSVLLRFTVC